MAGPNPYDNCPCGSGKKFKWCCTAYWDKIETGLAMLEQGQVENSLKMMEMLVKEHGNVPQTWGFYAHVLFRVDQVAKAEEMLEKAFAIDPNFAMGYLLYNDKSVRPSRNQVYFGFDYGFGGRAKP